VTRFGLFVLLRQFDIDGLLRVEELGGDRFEFDEEKMRLVGRKSGMSYEIGDIVRVTVVKADVEMGQVDFLMAGKTERVAPQQGPAGPQTRASFGSRPKPGKQEKRTNVEKAKQPFSKRGPAKDDSGSVRKSRVSHPRRSR